MKERLELNLTTKLRGGGIRIPKETNYLLRGERHVRKLMRELYLQLIFINQSQRNLAVLLR